MSNNSLKSPVCDLTNSRILRLLNISLKSGIYSTLIPWKIWLSRTLKEIANSKTPSKLVVGVKL